MDVTPKDVPTALIHLYRGELGRMTMYRTRLDTTTNWAVGTSAALTTFALGQERAPHFVFLLAVFLDLIFLWMEIRRFRFYELVRMRVRLLEVGFYAVVMGKPPREGWEDALWKSLETPRSPIGRLQAASVRLRRNYLWLFGAVYLGWLVKLSFGHKGIVDNAAVGILPGAVVFCISLVLMVGLAILASIYKLPEEE
ncbi:MAG: DUF2270 domain-containing protein [Polyangiaceae bacterium]|nr:DUF2270 domain-containing protein [Polyangiaceae bacterium]